MPSCMLLHQKSFDCVTICVRRRCCCNCNCSMWTRKCWEPRGILFIKCLWWKMPLLVFIKNVEFPTLSLAGFALVVRIAVLCLLHCNNLKTTSDIMRWWWRRTMWCGCGTGSSDEPNDAFPLHAAIPSSFNIENFPRRFNLMFLSQFVLLSHSFFVRRSFHSASFGKFNKFQVEGIEHSWLLLQWSTYATVLHTSISPVACRHLIHSVCVCAELLSGEKHKLQFYCSTGRRIPSCCRSCQDW